MLYLESPFYTIEGVGIFRDDAEPLQFYYLPSKPRIAEYIDGATGKAVPQIQMIKYRDGSGGGGGGLLSLDVDLGLEAGQLERIANELKKSERLSQQPRLSPVTLIGGKVELLVLGSSSEDTPSPDSSNLGIKVLGFSRPALYGDVRASFSVALDKHAASLMEKALSGEVSPLLVVYSLDYLALRPAFSVTLKADWEGIQKHLDDKFSVQVFIFAVEVEKAINEVVEKGFIQINVESYIPDGVDVGAASRRDMALDEVKKMIADAFFRPLLDPGAEESPQGGAPGSGGFSLGDLFNIGFYYRKTEITKVDRRRLNANIRERSAVLRSIYPQGYLSGLFRELSDRGQKLGNFLRVVDTDDPYFQNRTVKVVSVANFEEDSIQLISVKLQYGCKSQSLFLESSKDWKEVSWPSRIINGSFDRNVTVSYTVFFKNSVKSGWPGKITSPSVVVANDILAIDPREIYSVIYIPIVASNVPWVKYPQVLVQARYEDATYNLSVKDKFLLDRDGMQVWKVFSRAKNRRLFSYNLIYRSLSGESVERSFQSEDEILVGDPFPKGSCDPPA